MVIIVLRGKRLLITVNVTEYSEWLIVTDYSEWSGEARFPQAARK